MIMQYVHLNRNQGIFVLPNNFLAMYWLNEIVFDKLPSGEIQSKYNLNCARKFYAGGEDIFRLLWEIVFIIRKLILKS